LPSFSPRREGVYTEDPYEEFRQQRFYSQKEAHMTPFHREVDYYHFENPFFEDLAHSILHEYDPSYVFNLGPDL